NAAAGERANKRLDEESARKAKDKSQQRRAASAERNRQQRQNDKNRTANNKEAGTRTGNRQASERVAAQERRGETSSKATAKQKVQTAAGKPKKVIKKAVNNANTKVSEANTKVGNAVNKVKTKVSDAANQIKNKVSNTANQVKTKASDVSAKGLGKALEDIKGDMKDGKQESQNERNTKNKTKEKPADSKSPDEKGKTKNKNKTKKPKKTLSQQLGKQVKKGGKKVAEAFRNRPTVGGAVKGGLKGLAKYGAAAAAPVTAIQTALNPGEFVDRGKEGGLYAEGNSGLQNFGEGALQFLSDVGNNATFGLAGKLGESISNNLNGQGLNTDETLRQDALSAANPNAAPEEIANPANAPFQGAPQTNPNAQALQNGNFVAPVGLGSNNPFGRTAENQAAIDANVAEINQVTDTNKSLREARTGGAGGLSPEQKQITKLARSLRTGSIGDKQRNNGINQEIAALAGVSRDKTLLNMNENNVTGRLLTGQQSSAADQHKILTADTERLTTMLNDPEQINSLTSVLASRHAAGLSNAADASIYKQLVNKKGQTIPDGLKAIFTGQDGRLNPTNSSFSDISQFDSGIVPNALASRAGFGEGYSGPTGDIRASLLDGNEQDLFNAYRR
ncbi:MAG: hypothetical protein DRQ39_08695, partial [Gammaproteobacteria bacterium]